MVSVDMGAITESLFESELFGHVKGSFTDAHADRIGRFEAADGGTLFLDEIANLPYHLQAKLLTAIQKRCFIKVGSNTPQATNYPAKVCHEPRLGGNGAPRGVPRRLALPHQYHPSAYPCLARA